ncbi:glycoside hydrolase family 28 protein [Xylanimonas cellulosilytica]|uniref:glycoside hydrolase family 28 protein n=1 Tax=Xylanimonas cellulosilytica TaxID=186189 RepID=UPI00019C0A79|nr:glycoside hydrolase family 28 protein [Xylanimonas cellulosilytica]
MSLVPEIPAPEIPPGDLVTESLQARIDEAAARGGGRVTVGPGVHRTGSLRLRSHVELHVEAGAVLQFVPDPALYPPVEARWEGAPATIHQPCLYAHDAEHVAITGDGVIDGGGGPWWEAFRAGTLAHPRPTLVGLHRCTHVRLRDVTLRSSPAWTVHPLLCDDVAVRDVTIVNPPDSPNTDGIDPESCRNVRISGCHIDVGDDCIALKAGTEASPERVACENVVVTGCTLVHGHGGVVLGSEMSGGIRNVVVADCVFQGTDRGIRLKARRGRGGVVEDVRVSNVVMDDVGCPLVLNQHYDRGPGGDSPHVGDRGALPVDATTPLFRRITVAHVSARNVRAAAVFALGLAEQPVAELVLDDVAVSFAPDPEPFEPAMAAGVGPTTRRGVVLDGCDTVTLRGVHLEGVQGPGLVADRVARLTVTHSTVDGRPLTADAPVSRVVRRKQGFRPVTP